MHHIKAVIITTIIIILVIGLASAYIPAISLPQATPIKNS